MSGNTGQSSATAHQDHSSSISLFLSENYIKIGHFNSPKHDWEWLSSSEHHGAHDRLSADLTKAFFKKGLDHAKIVGRDEIVPVRGTLVLKDPNQASHRPTAHVFAESAVALNSHSHLYYAHITFDAAKEHTGEVSGLCHAASQDRGREHNESVHALFKDISPAAFDLKLERVPHKHQEELVAFLTRPDHHQGSQEDVKLVHRTQIDRLNLSGLPGDHDQLSNLKTFPTSSAPSKADAPGHAEPAPKVDKRLGAKLPTNTLKDLLRQRYDRDYGELPTGKEWDELVEDLLTEVSQEDKNGTKDSRVRAQIKLFTRKYYLDLARENADKAAGPSNTTGPSAPSENSAEGEKMIGHVPKSRKQYKILDREYKSHMEKTHGSLKPLTPAEHTAIVTRLGKKMELPQSHSLESWVESYFSRRLVKEIQERRALASGKAAATSSEVRASASKPSASKPSAKRATRSKATSSAKSKAAGPNTDG